MAGSNMHMLGQGCERPARPIWSAPLAGQSKFFLGRVLLMAGSNIHMLLCGFVSALCLCRQDVCCERLARPLGPCCQPIPNHSPNHNALQGITTDCCVPQCTTECTALDHNALQCTYIRKVHSIIPTLIVMFTGLFYWISLGKAAARNFDCATTRRGGKANICTAPH